MQRFLDHLTLSALRACLLVAALGLLSFAALAQTTDSTLLQDLSTAYSDTNLEPTAAAWEELIAHPEFTEGEIVFLEIAALQTEERASAEQFLAVAAEAVASAGGEFILAYDIMMPGTGDLADREGDRYVGGLAYAARFPSRAALVAMLLDETLLEAHAARRPDLAQLQWMLGTDRLPSVMALLPTDVAAASIETPYADGKDTATLLDELLAIYPDGGADPNRDQLQQLLDWEGYANEPLYYINLYDWGSYGEAGAAAHDAYNSGAQEDVFAHGVRVLARVDIEQSLVGPYAWDRLILPRWPSFKVFTDLRLVPAYVEAQAFRVESADVYGNYIATAFALDGAP